jgi:maltose O-acetyltransferase
VIAEQARTRASAQAEDLSGRRSLRLFVIRCLNFLTNYVVRFVPSFALRRAWYRRLGVQMGQHAGVHLGCYLWFYGPGSLRRTGCRIGDYSRINRDCTLDARGPLHIGANVSISPEVVILTAAHRVDDPSFAVEMRPVVIEDHVWVGTRAMIMPGVTLGRGSVVAAGAIVTRDVAPFCIVAGVPARPVGERPAEAATYVLDGNFPLFE